MKMNQLFVQLFETPMKEQGFSRKGYLFYRLRGEILQGLVLKTTNPYDIGYTFYPYWNHEAQANLPNLPMNKGIWAEENCVGNHYYYRAATTEENEKAMRYSLHFVFQHVLPILDQVKDFESYLSLLRCPPSTPFLRIDHPYGHNISIRQTVHANDLLWKAYLDGSFEPAMQLLNDVKAAETEDSIRRRLAQPRRTAAEVDAFFDEISAMLPVPVSEETRAAHRREAEKTDEEIIAEIQGETHNHFQKKFAAFLEAAQTGDTQCFQDTHGQMAQHMVERLATELKLLLPM